MPIGKREKDGGAKAVHFNVIVTSLSSRNYTGLNHKQRD
jgi:hypothetical protein